MTLLKQLILFSTSVLATLVPAPNGRYSVAMKVQALTDPNRFDLLDPNSTTTKRRVLFSIFLPVDKRLSCPTELVTYMTPGVAAQYGAMAAQAGLPDDIFVPFEYKLCDLSKLGARCSPHPKEAFPVILFTPGFGDSRLVYGARARSLASRGYAVVTVDHPYDADVVEFPDGTVIRGANISDEDPVTLSKVVQVRQQDLSFVLDQLANKTIQQPLLKNFPGSLNFGRIAVYSHSLGGAAAAALAKADKRVRGGVDFDGQLVDPIKTAGLSKPFLLAGRTNHSNEDPTWNEFWPNLKGPRAELAFANTTHGAFLDLLTILTALDIPDNLKPVIQSVLGSVDPTVMDKAFNGVLEAFFELTFRGKTTPLANIAKKFPEVSIVKADLKRGKGRN